MKKKLSIVVMMHPSREKYIPYLKKMLGDIPFVMDRKNNIWDTCRRAWLAHDFACEYGIIIQDDAIICNDFRKRAELFLTGDFIYSFYAGKFLAGRILDAERKKLDHVISPMIYNEIALCMKTSRIKDMVNFCDELDAQTDQDIVKYARKQGLQIFYTIPSLINHRDEHSIYREKYNKEDRQEVRKAFRFHD